MMNKIEVSPIVRKQLEDFVKNNDSGIVYGEEQDVYEFMKFYTSLLPDNEGTMTFEREPKISLQEAYPEKDVISLKLESKDIDSKIYKDIAKFHLNHAIVTYEPDINLLTELHYSGVSVLWGFRHSAFIPSNPYQTLSDENKNKISVEEFNKCFRFAVYVTKSNENKLNLIFIKM